MSETKKDINIAKLKVKQDRREEHLKQEALNGANALNEYKIVSLFMLKERADIMDAFELEDTLETEKLQEIHRRYRTLVRLEDAFRESINSGQQAQTKLKST